MAYKILEQNGIDNENIDGAAFNNFSAGNRDGIIKDVLNECALSLVGNIISVAAGEMILHGFRVKITAAETLSAASAPAVRKEYQIVAQVTLSDNHAVAFTLFFQLPQALVQNPMFDTDLGTYQAELGRFYQETDGAISGLRRTLPVIYADSERYAEEAKAAAEQAQAAAEEAQEGAAQAKLDIPLAPEQTGVAITGENTLAGASVSVTSYRRNLLSIPTSETKVQHGLTVTANEDGSYDAVLTENANNWTCSFDIVPFTLKAGITYYLHLRNKVITTNSAVLLLDENSATITDWAFSPINRIVGFSLTEDKTVHKIGIYCNNLQTPISFSVQPSVELTDEITPYTPYISDGTSVDVTACGGNLFNIGAWNGTSIQTGGYIRNAITLSDGVFTNPISQYNDFYSPNIQIPVKKGKVTVSADVQCPEEGYLQFSFGFSGPTETTASTEYKALTAEDTEWHNYQATFDVGKDGICYFGCANRTVTTGENYAVNFRNVQVELGETATAYTPYTGATYPATVGQSVEIVQYDKITNVFTDNAGVTVSAAFRQSTRYELDDRLVPLFGAFANRPTDIQPFARLYVATDQTGDNKVTILPANTDGSVSENWITI